jgi:hypothetical protein
MKSDNFKDQEGGQRVISRVKMVLRKMRFEDWRRMEVAQNRVHWCIFILAMLKLPFLFAWNNLFR